MSEDSVPTLLSDGQMKVGCPKGKLSAVVESGKG